MRTDYSDTTVIVPTLNEASNIGRLVLLLTGRYNGISVIVADDGSTDGTRSKVLAIASHNHRVMFLDRSGMEVHGLAVSVLDAAMHVRTPKTIVMDADLQHPVDKVGEISDKLGSYDIVVAVRTYVKEWGAVRKIISKGMAYIAYALFKLRGRKTCDDLMSGFFGIRSSMMKRLVRTKRQGFVGQGYKILLDILRLAGRECRVGEVYYSTFHRREHGESKLGYKHIVYTLMSTLK